MWNKYNQKWVSLLWGEKRWAVTIGCITFYSVPKSEVHASWQAHEDWHKVQWRRDWYVLFLIKYLYYNWKYGYWNNPYEVEAREKAMEVHNGN
jgi:hypothetical protein